MTTFVLLCIVRGLALGLLLMAAHSGDWMVAGFAVSLLLLTRIVPMLRARRCSRT